jgi:tetratricopeptide (TPR) repeat protein
MEKAKVLLEKGKQLLQEGDWPRASEVLKEALGFLEGKDNSDEGKTLLCDILIKKAHADSRLSEFELARTELEDALEMARVLKDVKNLADAYRGLAYTFILDGDIDQAMHNYMKALEHAEKCNDRDLLGRVHLELGNVYYYRYEYEKAKEEYGRALAILKAVGNQAELARVYNNLGDIHKTTGDLNESIEYHRRCMELSKKIGNLTMEGFAALNAAEVFILMKEPRFTREYLSLASKVLKKTNDRIGQASVFRIYGMVYLAEGQLDAAETAMNKCLAIAKAQALHNTEAEGYRALADILIAKGKKAAAREALEKAMRLFDSTKRPKESKEAKHLMASLNED